MDCTGIESANSYFSIGNVASCSFVVVQETIKADSKIAPRNVLPEVARACDRYLKIFVFILVFLFYLILSGNFLFYVINTYDRG